MAEAPVGEFGAHPGETLSQAITRGVARRPDGEIVFWSGGRMTTVTLAQVAERGQRLAGGLHALGLLCGDAAVVQVPNSPEGSVTWYAGCRLGFLRVPVVTIYGAAELRYSVPTTRGPRVVVPDRSRKVEFLGRVAGMGPCTALEYLMGHRRRRPGGGGPLGRPGRRSAVAASGGQPWPGRRRRAPVHDGHHGQAQERRPLEQLAPGGDSA